MKKLEEEQPLVLKIDNLPTVTTTAYEVLRVLVEGIRHLYNSDPWDFHLLERYYGPFIIKCYSADSKSTGHKFLTCKDVLKN